MARWFGPIYFFGKQVSFRLYGSDLKSPKKENGLLKMMIHPGPNNGPPSYINYVFLPTNSKVLLVCRLGMEGDAAMKSPDTTCSRPRKAMSAYNYYFHERKLEMQALFVQEHGRKPSFTELSREVGKRWKLVPSHDRSHFEKLAAEDKRRYGLDYIAWRMNQQDPGGNSDNLPESHDDAGHVQSFYGSSIHEGDKKQQSTPALPSRSYVTGHDLFPNCEPRASSSPCMGSALSYTTLSSNLPANHGASLLLPAASASVRTGGPKAEPAPPVTHQDDNRSVSLFADDDVRFLEETFGFGSEQFFDDKF